MGLRRAAELSGVDRKAVRRDVSAAVELGLARDGGQQQLTDELLGQVVERVHHERRRRTAAALAAKV